ncbi:MAG: dephospho-CoA kinase [Selenomonadaceae bacterium]
MFIIGLTGGIASGKSTVSKILAEQGAIILDADAVARTLSMPNEAGWKLFVEHFGSAVLLENQCLDRAKIGQLVFADDKEREWVNNMMHPQIKEELLRRLARLQAENAKVVVLDIPLFFETKWDAFVNTVWVVYVNEKIQVERLMKRNNLSEKLARQRIASQISLKEKVKQADFVINNTENIESTRQQVVAAWEKIWKEKIEQ